MNAAMLLLAIAASGVVAGRAELPGGGFEYVIQIEPQLLDSQPGGVLVSSDVPPGLRGARRYRVIVGEGPLPVGVTAIADLPAEQLVLAPPQPPTTPTPPSDPLAVNPLPLDDGKAQPTEFRQPDDAEPLHVGRPELPAEPPSQTDVSNEPQEESKSEPKPWTVLVLTMLGLFVSLGGNVYLGWNFLGLRKRHRAMIGAKPQASG